ncbi:hypothetical protein CDN99_08315 [Roseateles aquatilis]|jgi:hypothetical protein|uniref:Uncharacterized protein n=4 Tax=Pseudomonadota TaxID=1224 RepID=A0A246JF79_9BURK|nr:hypothetical protein [Pseudomonadota]ARP93429.1 hypothetical protein CAL15_02970 [Bordetella genomosp. 13]KDD44404.1 hypothetical protein L532_0465 [Bordetella bronchiseptica OSU095]OWQ91181.1 hypothetical protein CDN99_08315 [Roseateles aquatilis]PLC49920.1 hypothetical protein CR159_09700 [Pollutimonas subterranea]TDK27280.1 hypothetical protein E2F46_03510 [Luteimonas aestuarii]
MSRLAWLRLPWLFNRRVGVALLWTLLVVAAAVAVNIAGIHVVGGVDGWENWLRAHAGHFFLWRLLLYAATAYGWWWMRGRLRQREPSAEAHQRLRRTEIAAVTALVLLEGSQLLRHG